MTTYGELSHTQAKALAAFVNALRPDWDKPGIEDALGRARRRADAPTLAIAAIRAATSAKNRTPAVIGMDGEHWRTPVPARVPHYAPKPSEECDRHPGQYADACSGCAADRLVGDELAARRRTTDRATAADRLTELRAVHSETKRGLCSHGVPFVNCKRDHDEQLHPEGAPT